MSTKIYAEVTARIVADLEQGVAPWVKPWSSGMGGKCLPVNASTDRSYRGVNVLTLWAAAAASGYPLLRWLTFRQAKKLGGSVRKGEKATAVVFFKSTTVGDEPNEHREKADERTREVRFLRYFWVFNVAQVEGLPAAIYDALPIEPDEDRHGRAMSFLQALNAKVFYGGDRACYVPSQDYIRLPYPSAFDGPEHYYATSLHEHAHWSGHSGRLDRDLTGRFGSNAYAAEELVAELTAAFLCAELGVEGRLRHAEYIGSWLELLQSDTKAIFTAASRASQAADYLRSLAEAPTVHA